MGRLDGKVALVTGAARGQGAAEARLFAAEGARVLLGDVLDDEGAAVAAAIGDAAVYRHLDVTSDADWEAALADVRDRWGALHVLVANAALFTARAAHRRHARGRVRAGHRGQPDRGLPSRCTTACRSSATAGAARSRWCRR